MNCGTKRCIYRLSELALSRFSKTPLNHCFTDCHFAFELILFFFAAEFISLLFKVQDIEWL